MPSSGARASSAKTPIPSLALTAAPENPAGPQAVADVGVELAGVEDVDADPLTLKRLLSFYIPLALTPLLTLAAHPISSAAISPPNGGRMIVKITPAARARKIDSQAAPFSRALAPINTLSPNIAATVSTLVPVCKSSPVTRWAGWVSIEQVNTGPSIPNV